MVDNISIPTVDVSSYRNALPTGEGALQTAQRLGGLEQQKVQLDQSKLKLMNERFQIINNELSTLANDPTASRDKILTKMNTLSRMGLVPKEQLAEFEKDVPQDPKQIPQFLEQTLQRGMSVMEHINFQYGQPGSVDTGQAIIPTVTSPRFGVRATNAPIQRQVPPTTPTVNPETNQPMLLGPQGYQGAPGGSSIPLPVAPQMGGQGQIAPVAPVQRVVPATPLPSQSGGLPTGQGMPQAAPNGLPVAQQPVTTAPMGGPPRPTGPVTGMAPLFEEGKKTLTEDQAIAAKRMMAAKPAIQALDLMKQPGFLSGPGTEEYTKIVAALKTWGLIETAAENDPTAVRQEVAKKLAQYVSGSPVAARSDASQLLAEASSPNPKVQILPALIKLTKDAVILDRVQSAMPTAFKNADLSKYGQHRATFPQSIDERAFGLDLEENGSKLVDEMAKKLQSKNAREKAEANKFFNSLRIAKDQGFYQ